MMFQNAHGPRVASLMPEGTNSMTLAAGVRYQSRAQGPSIPSCVPVMGRLRPVLTPEQRAALAKKIEEHHRG
jgi:hypothetical protein